MGCQQGKQVNNNAYTVRKCLQEINEIIQSVENLSSYYLKENKVAFMAFPSIDKLEQFLKYAHSQYKSETTLPEIPNNLSIKISFEEYINMLISYQEQSRPLIIKGFTLYESKQKIDGSPIHITLLQKLNLLQDFTLNLQLPKVSNADMQRDLEDKLQNITKQVTKSLDIQY